MNDAVNNPKHYTSDPSGIECIEITRHRNFNVGNAIKYLWRAGLKDSDATVQDLQKAVWYINDEIERIKLENEKSRIAKIFEDGGDPEPRCCTHGFYKDACRKCNAEAKQ